VRRDGDEHVVRCSCGDEIRHESRPVAMAAHVEHAVSAYAEHEQAAS
jgi:hypothetical protein